MNNVIYKTCEYIIDKKIKKVNMDNVLKIHINKMTKYISEDDIYSFEFNTRIFKKLVLYDYCYHYYIDGLKEDEVDMINSYIHHDTYELNFHAEPNMLRFLNWCKIYNRRTKKIVSNKNGKNYYNDKQIYIVSRDTKHNSFK